MLSLGSLSTWLVVSLDSPGICMCVVIEIRQERNRNPKDWHAMFDSNNQEGIKHFASMALSIFHIFLVSHLSVRFIFSFRDRRKADL